MGYAIEICNLTKKYPGFTLDNINLQIPHGRIVGLVGENGAGKTTLISLILNQLKRDTGNIKIFGKDNIEEEYRIKQDIGFLVDECCFHYMNSLSFLSVTLVLIILIISLFLSVKILKGSEGAKVSFH